MLIGNVPDTWPAGTVTVEGTVAFALLLVSDTIVPPLVPGPFRVTVPVDEFPPTTDEGFRVTETTDAGFTVN